MQGNADGTGVRSADFLRWPSRWSETRTQHARLFAPTQNVAFAAQHLKTGISQAFAAIK